MLPTIKADQTRFSLRKGSTAAAWETVKGIRKLLATPQRIRKHAIRDALSECLLLRQYS